MKQLKTDGLQRGNLVMSYGSLTVIESLGAKGINGTPSDDGKPYGMHRPLIEWDDVELIFITDEWLIKLGWAWNKETNSWEKFPNGDARMHINKQVSESYTMFNYVLKATICERLWYVHQLQNLYYLMTNGEQLQVTSSLPIAPPAS